MRANRKTFYELTCASNAIKRENKCQLLKNLKENGYHDCEK